MVSRRCWFLFQHEFSEFLTLNPFLGKFGPKESKLFVLPENWYTVISRLLILVPTLVLWISKTKSIFGQIWIEKLKVVQFGWKLAHRVSQRCWFLFRHYFSQFPTVNCFLGKFGPRNSKLFILTENWHTWYMEDADSYSGNSFLKCQP